MKVATWLRVGVFATLVLALLWLWSENRRMVHGRAHVAADTARAEERAASRVRRLEGELRQALESREALLATIDERVAELERMRAERKERLRRATKPPPEGVRLALLAINDLLHADGYSIRFLHAEQLEGKELAAVEFTEYRPEWFATSLYAAGRVQFELDRAKATLTLRCFDGHVFARDVEREFPADGELIVLPSVDVVAWEDRLPYLVRAHGALPVAADEVRQKPALDAGSARIWAERLDELLRIAETELTYRVARVRDLHERRFVDVLLHGYDEKRQLRASGKAGTLEVHVDDEADTTELVLRNGSWRRPEGKLEVDEKGYRILLPAVDAKTARATMLGMVVSG